MASRNLGRSIKPADAQHLARIHRRAFPGFFLAKLGEPFLVQFYRGFVAEPTSVVSVYRDEDGAPIGVAVGTTNPDGFFRQLLRRRFWGFVGASIQATIKDPKVAPRLLGAVRYRGDNPPGREGALLSSICVDPAHEGTGVGRAVLEDWARAARESGCEFAFLTTDAVGNDAVNAWYARGGWTLSDQFVAHGGRRMNRYQRDLRTLDVAQ
ncbi:MAG: GNAT family N-acetyltransferase [Propionibacteriaceae bacterium]|nr:GNAT family N-acetyltransferase [Propionibacteriaceae bacterium]